MTGTPDGCNDMPMASKPKALRRSGGDGGSVGIDFNDAKSDMTPMSDACRKGASGKPIAPSGPTSSETTDYTPMSPEASPERYGMGRGKYGANTGEG